MFIAPISSEHLDQHQRGYPRPQLRRDEWYSLNGSWEFALDTDGVWGAPAEVQWSDHIFVPFAPEAPLSGVGHTGFVRACWYRKRCELPPRDSGERWSLIFGAVDWHATVWINGICVGEHTGGYTPFNFDITHLVSGSECEIVVRAEDDPLDLAKPRGKQDWQLEPHSIWYPRTSGIWQTVWMEKVPATRLARVSLTPSLARWEIGVEVWLEGERRNDLHLGVTLRNRDTVLAADRYLIVHDEVHRGIALSDPGIDDSRNELLWSPQAPNLIEIEFQVWDSRGELIDSVHSYTALRTATVQGDRFLLNGRPYLLRMVLDQGYWPEGGLTAPNDAALRRDVELTREMGFNGVRKHQKIEDPRYLYWADTIGLAVWEEMPSAYRFTRLSVERLSREWTSVIQRDYGHPCIVAWVPINESWGVPNLPDNPRERHYVQALYHLTKTLDATRPVIGNDGWESVATDIIGIHDYDDQPARMAARYHAEDVRPRLFKRERPGGRLLILEGHSPADHPLMLTEFGGIALRTAANTWGYSTCRTPEELARGYAQLLDVIRDLTLLAGFCYTQFADTYQEANGLLYADRTPKIPMPQIAAATGGRAAPREVGLDQLQAATETGEGR